MAGHLPRTSSTVHPRRCGEQAGFTWPRYVATGSSPQVRGTDGNRGHRPTGGPVHPRRCGEQYFSELPVGCIYGSSPQVRGTDGAGSPRRYDIRFIPAGAGNRSRPIKRKGSVTVHPRRCGEQSFQQLVAAAAYGSSPQVRGTVPRHHRGTRQCRFIPAGAGNRTCSCPDARMAAVHPRRCGEQ